MSLGRGAIPFARMRYHLLPLLSVVKRSTTELAFKLFVPYVVTGLV